MKIFVILLYEGASPPASAVSLLRGPAGCSSDTADTVFGASGGKYFLHAPSAAAIVGAFKDVGAQLSAIRLVQ